MAQAWAMSLSRRAFLQVFGAGVAATAAQHLLPATHLVFEPTIHAPLGVEPAVRSLEWMTRQMLVRFEQLIGADAECCAGFDPKGAIIGDTVVRRYPTGNREVPLTEQFGINLDMLRGEEYDIERTIIDPAAAQLAQFAKDRKLNTFGALGVPPATHVPDAARVWHRDGRGAAMRGVALWDVLDHRMVMRFDILGGRA